MVFSELSSFASRECEPFLVFVYQSMALQNISIIPPCDINAFFLEGGFKSGGISRFFTGRSIFPLETQHPVSLF